MNVSESFSDCYSFSKTECVVILYIVLTFCLLCLLFDEFV